MAVMTTINRLQVIRHRNLFTWRHYREPVYLQITGVLEEEFISTVIMLIWLVQRLRKIFLLKQTVLNFQ